MCRISNISTADHFLRLIPTLGFGVEVVQWPSRAD